MALFEKIFGPLFEPPNWEEIKRSKKTYPKQSISIIKVNTQNGFGTGWVDKAYKDYKYKVNCCYNFLIKIDLKNSVAKQNTNLDMGTIEEYFVRELRRLCVAHIVARVVTDSGLNIEMYLEKIEDAFKHLNTLANSPDRLVSFEIEVNEDPQWAAVSGLMNL